MPVLGGIDEAWINYCRINEMTLTHICSLFMSGYVYS